ncbi:BNR-repeat neuraminidase N-terminal domain-containing protein [Adhaeribacter soli]|nr:BNR-repeat neuraminidase N-terminal domain-containing protein [Adhaeribacter soli]
MVMLPATAAFSQTTVTVGTSTTTQRYPFGSFFGYERSAALYTAAQIGQTGSITQLAWYPTSAKAASPVKIYLKQTTATSPAADTWANTINGAILVYDGSPALTAGSWNTIALTNSFDYFGGTENLLVLVETNHGGSGNGAGSTNPAVRYSSVTSTHRYWQTDTNPPTTETGTSTSNRPNIQVTFVPMANMSYASSTATQTNLTPVLPNTVNQQVIGFQVVTSGGANPLALTDINLNTTGTTNTAEIQNAKIFYTGSSSTFSTTSQFGATVAAPAGAYAVTGSQALKSGANYFWLTYDIAAGATPGNAIDAQITSLTVGGTAYTPSITNPAGVRTIMAPLNGNYTINNTQATGGRNYASFADAISDLNILGISGNVTFNVSTGQTFNESPLVLTATGTNSNAITFQRSGVGANPKIQGTNGAGSADYILTLSGSDYITFDGIDFADNPANATAATKMEQAIRLAGAATDGCKYNTFKNCDIALDKTNTNTTYGIYFSSAATSAAGSNSNNEFLNNAVHNALYGYYVYGNSTYLDDANRIGNQSSGTSSIYDLGNGTSTGYGVYYAYQTNFKLHNTAINNFSTSGSLYGINSFGSGTTAEIYNNTISALSTSGTSYSLYGIYMSSGGATSIYSNAISNLSASSTGTSVYGIYVAVTGANIYGNTVDDLRQDGGSSSSIYGINFAGSGTNNIYNNTVSNLLHTAATGAPSLYGLYVSSGTTNNIYGNNISNVSSAAGSTGPSVYGMQVTSGTTNNVYNNTIQEIISSSTGSSSAWGALFSGGTTNNISRNKIYNVATATTGSGIAYGLSVTSGVANVSNNAIYDIRANGATGTPGVRAVNFSGGSNHKLYYNSVYLNGVSSIASHQSAAVYITNSVTTVDMRNNMLVNNYDVATGTRAVAVYRSAVDVTKFATTSNNNLVYAGAPSVKNLLFYDGTNAAQTLADYRLRIGSPRETLAVTENPPFVSATTPFNLNLKTNVSTQAESGGEEIASFVDDYSAVNSRTGYPKAGQANGGGTLPDIGAYEGDFTPKDLTPPTITFTALAGTHLLTNRTLTATITDVNGINTGANGPRLYYRKSGEATYQVAANPTVNGDNYTFTIDYSLLTGGGVQALDRIEYYVAAEDANNNAATNPLGGSGATPPGTTAPATPASYIIQKIYSGNYYVGTSRAVDFATITEAATKLSEGAIDGDVTLQLIDASYSTNETFPIDLTETGKLDPASKIILKPENGVVATISGSSTTAIFKLNKISNFTLDGSNNGTSTRNLTIRNTSTAANTAVIQIVSTGTGAGTNNATLKNLILEAGSNTINTTFGIHAGGTTISTSGTGADNDYLTIENNKISKAAYGIYARGIAGGVLNNLIIKNNEIGGTAAADYIVYRGIDLQHAASPLIETNVISGVYGYAGSSFSISGIEIGSGVTSALINRNKVYDVVQPSTSEYGAYGINIADGTDHLVVNNVIYGMNVSNYSATSTSFNPFGIRIGGGTGHKIYYNSVNLYGSTLATKTVAGSALVVTSTSVTGLDIRNNIFANTMSVTGTAGYQFAVWFPASYNFANATLNHNSYYVTSDANHFVGKIGTTAASGNYTDVLAWRVVSQASNAGNDVASPAVSGTAPFTSDTDLSIPNGTVTSLESGGATVTDINKDFNDVTRPAGTGTAPDIGAYEFEGSTNDLVSPAIANISVTPAGNQCEPVSRTITAEVSDNVAVASVKLKYSFAGVPQTDITMTRSSGNAASGTYTATLPVAPSRNVLVSYSIEASDAKPNTASSTAVTYTDGQLSINAGADQAVNQGSPVTLTATSSNFPSSLKITEVIQNKSGTGVGTIPAYASAGADFLEITNLGNTTADLTGMTLTVVGSGARNYTFGTVTPVTLGAGQVLVLHIGAGTDNAANNYYNTGGTNDGILSTDPSGYVLKTSGGVVLDAVATNGYTFLAASGVTASDWSGNIATSSAGVRRTNAADTNDASDWTISANSTLDLGVANAGLNTINTVANVTWTSVPVTSTQTGREVTYNGLATGTYTFTATYNDGTCTTTDEVVVEVVPPVAPVAGFTATPTMVAANTTVAFTDTSTNLPASWNWVFSPNTVTFVGGTTAASQHPEVRFNAEGKYTVTLTVTNPGGNDDEVKTDYIVVDGTAPVISSVTASPAGVQCTPTARTITATVTDAYAGVNTVTLKYSIAGVAQSDVVMNRTSGDNLNGTYQATLPAAGANNVKVDYHIVATDNKPNTATGTTSSFTDAYPLAVNAGADQTINLGSPVTLTATSPNFPSGLKITEVMQYSLGTGAGTIPAYASAGADFLEITNLSTSTADLTGMTLTVVGVGARNYTFGAITPVTLGAGQVLVLHIGTGTDDAANNYYNTGGTRDAISSTSLTGYILKKASGEIVDAVATNGYTFLAASGVTSSDWSDNIATSSGGVRRTNAADTNDASDWTISTNSTLDLGVANAGLNTINTVVDITWTSVPVTSTQTGAEVTYNGLATGTYTFTATYNDGTCTTTDEVVVEVVPPVAPVAGFTATPTMVAANTTVAFTDTSTNLPASWNWVFSPNTVTFVGGTTAASQHPEVRFNAEGKYTVTLTVTNPGGNDDEVKTDYIVVDGTAPVISSVTASPAGVQCTPTARTITATVTDAYAGVNTVTLKYSIAGVAQSDVVMNRTSGDNLNGTYQATLPAAGANNVKVDYHIVATDNKPNTATGTTSSFTDAYPLAVNAGADQTINLGSPVTLTATSPNMIPGLRITEVIQNKSGTGVGTIPAYASAGSDFLEITNLGTTTADLTGMTLTVVGSGARNYTFGTVTPVTLGAGQVLVLHIGAGTDNAANNYYNTGGTNDGILSTDPSGYVLKTSGGVVLDAVATNGYTFLAASGVTASDWSGNIATSTAGVRRTNATDTNVATDWAISANSTLDLGVSNAGLNTINTVANVTWASVPVTSTQTGREVTYNGLAVGTYTFTASYNDGTCTTTDEVVVEVVPPVAPVAAFTASATTVTNLQTVTFTDQSTNVPDTWNWVFSPNTVTFVGGTSATSQHPQVKFNMAGSYTVTLTASNPGGTDDEEKVGYINVSLDYCTPLYGTGTGSGDFINGVELGTINNQNSGAASGPVYNNYTAQSTDLNMLNQYTLKVTNGNAGSGVVAAWIDYNQNGVFEGTEKLGEVTGLAAGALASINFTVPLTALNGSTRIRVREVWSNTNIDPCNLYTYGETEDYTVNILNPIPMTYVSSVVKQPHGGVVGIGTSGRQMIDIEVVTSGIHPVSQISSFTLNTNGSDNAATDIAAAHLYTTATATFNAATATLVGTATNPNGSFTITPATPVDLVTGTNYFWLTYDLATTGVPGNKIDAEVTHITIDGVDRVPTDNAPAGFRQLEGALAGPYEVGTGFTVPGFATLEEAVTALNTRGVSAAVDFNLINTSYTVTNPLVINRIPGSSSNNVVTFKPAPATVVSITNSGTGRLFDLSEADYVTFDGSNNGTTSRNLTLTTAATANPVIAFSNDATNNIVKNCIVESANTGTSSGAILIGTAATGATGNDNITLQNNTIRNRTGANYANAIYASGTATIANSAITIAGNEIANFTANGVSVTSTGNGDTWSITGNKFYNNLTPNTSQTAINFVPGTTANGNVISDNAIGGQSANAGGSPWLNSGAVAFRGITINAGTVAGTSVQNNVISNIRMSSTSSSSFIGINVTAGKVSVGELTANQIGSATANSITLNGTSTSSGITVASTEPAVIKNNLVRNFSLTSSGAFTGIGTSGSGSGTIESNTVSQIASTSTSTVAGISNGFSGATTIEANQIVNLAKTGANGGVMKGIVHTGSSAANQVLIRNNTVNALTTTSTATGTTTTASLVGISMESSGTALVIEGNSLNELWNTGTSGSTSVYGILNNGSGSNLTIKRNRIFDLRNASTSGTPIIYGIYYNFGISTIETNMISITNGANTNAVQIRGYFENSGALVSNVYYNTIYVGGTSTAGSLTSAAYYRGQNTTLTAKNNIFYNARTGGTGVHTAITNTVTTNWTAANVDNNLMYAANPTTVGQWGGTAATNNRTLATWKTSSAADANSFYSPVVFVNTTNDLRLATNDNCNLDGRGTAIATIDKDINNANRPTTQGSTLATRPDVGFSEFTPDAALAGTWTGSESAVWGTGLNWCRESLPTATSNIVVPQYVSNYPNVTTGTAQVNNLTVSTGATMTVSGGTLEVNGNLTNNGTFSHSNGWVEFKGGAAQVIPGVTFANLRINGSGTKSLGDNVTVNNALDMASGILYTTSYKVTLSPAATIAETGTSHVIGVVQSSADMNAAGAFTFGGLGIKLEPQAGSANFPGVTNVIRHTGITVSGPNGSKSISRIYDIVPVDAAKNANLNVKMTMDYMMHELGTIQEENLVMFKSKTMNGPWEPKGYLTRDNVTKQLSINGITDFSFWTMGDATNPLPVELISFTAVKKGNNALLNWATAMEKNNQGFEVQVSEDGREFRALGFVEGKGGNSMQQYSFTDTEEGKFGTRYYRLKQLDLDGTAAYYGPRAVQFETLKLTVSAHPNPFVGEVNLTIQSAKAEVATVSITDMAGKTVYQKQVKVAKGLNTVKVELNNNHATGIYLMTTQMGSERLHTKLIKQ